MDASRSGSPSAEFSIRSASAEDFPVIKALVHSVGINPLGLSWERFLIAVDSQGVLIGCGQIKPHKDGSLELASIAVVPAWRKRGIASAIIQRLAEGQAELYLTCRAQLVPFYERFGFYTVTVEEMPAHFRRLFQLMRAITSLGATQGIRVMKRTAT